MQRGGAVTAQEREDMRIRAERLLLVSLPPALRETLFETNDMKKLQARMHETLEPIQNKYINKHLMYLLVDLISSRILPELLEEKS
ncbi:hypothetical protein BDF14DRAFT_1420794 [Spinellus fusiger]|nr:hypothetical protein BDF14DRAFT_1420794 [Spinellus fusiger]